MKFDEKCIFTPGGGSVGLNWSDRRRQEDRINLIVCVCVCVQGPISSTTPILCGMGSWLIKCPPKPVDREWKWVVQPSISESASMQGSQACVHVASYLNMSVVFWPHDCICYKWQKQKNTEDRKEIDLQNSKCVGLTLHNLPTSKEKVNVNKTRNSATLKERKKEK